MNNTFFEGFELEPDGQLWDYQLQHKHDIYHAWKKHRSVMLQMPTGTGKTRVFSSIVKDIHQVSILKKKALRTLILVHRKELIEQASENIGYQYNIAHGVIMSRYWQQKKMPTQIASVQTLIRRLDQWTEKEFDYIIIDEAHHALARTYIDICNAFPDAKILGVTATPYRLNGASFKSIFDHLIVSKSVDEFIKIGKLSKYNYCSIAPRSSVLKSILNIKEFDISGDYSERAMYSILDNKVVRADILKAYNKYAADKKGIVYTINKSHNKQICDLYNEAGIIAKAIDSDTKHEEREQIVQDFKSGRIKVLCNVNIFSEGFDCPDIEFIQIARPTMSLSLYLQQVGRGLRPHPEIDEVVFLDNVGSFHRFGLPSSRRDWNRYFEGFDPASEFEFQRLESVGKEVHYIEDIVHGDEEVELLYESELPKSEFENEVDYYVFIKTDGYHRIDDYMFGFEYDSIYESIMDELNFAHEPDEVERIFTEGDNKMLHEYFPNISIFNVYRKVRKGKKYGLYYTEDQNQLLPVKYDYIGNPNGFGQAIISNDEKFGLIDLNKKKLIFDCTYDSIESMFDQWIPQRYIVKKNKKLGVVDLEGNKRIDISYDEVVFNGNDYCLRNNEKWIIYHEEEGEIEEFDSFRDVPFRQDCAIVEYKDMYGIWSYKLGYLIVPIIYDSIEIHENRSIVVQYLPAEGRRYYLLDDNFDIILSASREMTFIEGQNIRIRDFGFGISDMNGNIKVKPKYEVLDFYKDVLVVRADHKWRVIDWDENILFEGQRRKEVMAEYDEYLQNEIKTYLPPVKPSGDAD